MLSTLRSIAAVVAGFIVASIVMMIIESINGRFLFPELGKAAEGATDREKIRALVARACRCVIGRVRGLRSSGASPVADAARLSAR